MQYASAVSMQPSLPLRGRQQNAQRFEKCIVAEILESGLAFGVSEQILHLQRNRASAPLLYRISQRLVHSSAPIRYDIHARHRSSQRIAISLESTSTLTLLLTRAALIT